MGSRCDMNTENHMKKLRNGLTNQARNLFISTTSWTKIWYARITLLKNGSVLLLSSVTSTPARRMVKLMKAS